MDRLFPKKDPEGLKRFLAIPETQLSTQEYERQYAAKLHATPMPCPMCFEPVSLYDAGDDSQAVGEPYDGPYVCPNCDTELAKVAPFFIIPGTPGWHWRRKHPIPGKRARGTPPP